MANVLLLVLLIVSIIMTGLILIQRSEGGALGIGGGGGGGGGFMSGRSAANSVSRMTGILGTAFLICSLALSIVFNKENEQTSILDETVAETPLTLDLDSGEGTDPLESLSEDAATDETVTVETLTDPETTPSEDEPEAPQTTDDE